jgi:flagellum-specific peptidoglycan hydrolase FlgJ
LGIWLGNDYYGTIGTQEMSETLEQESQEDEVNEDVDLNQSATSVVYLEKLSYQQVDQEEWDEENISLLIKRAQSPELTEVGKELVKNYPAQLDFQFNTATHEFIKQISEKARKLGQEYDVFASVLIAQAILESGNGSSLLSKAPYYNLFGIKGSYREGAVVMTTKEDLGNGEMIEIQDAFRVYPSYDESLTDYIALIRGGVSHDSFFYKSVWRSEAKNYLRATDALTGTYATDTSYNQKLNSLIAVYELTQYDEDQSQQSGVFIKGLEEVPNEYRELMTFPAYNGKDYNTSGSYPVGQCTWYAFNRVAQLGGRVDDYMGNGGDWGTTGLRLGYQVSRTPKAGTLISFSHGTAGSDPRYGHVAFVEAVGPNGILISEANVYGGTTISYRVIGNDLARSSLVQYITPK